MTMGSSNNNGDLVKGCEGIFFLVIKVLSLALLALAVYFLVK